MKNLIEYMRYAYTWYNTYGFTFHVMDSPTNFGPVGLEVGKRVALVFLTPKQYFENKENQQIWIEAARSAKKRGWKQNTSAIKVKDFYKHSVLVDKQEEEV